MPKNEFKWAEPEILVQQIQANECPYPNPISVKAVRSDHVFSKFDEIFLRQPNFQDDKGMTCKV